MNTPQQQNPDGSWSPAKPVEPKNIEWRIESWLWRHGFKRAARFMGRWDERKLGK